MLGTSVLSSVGCQEYLVVFDMEAAMNLKAMKLQAIEDSVAGAAVIETRGDEVLIDGLAVTDRTLVELIERRLEREVGAEETVTDALAIGARVLDREATGAEVEAVRHELKHAAAEAERSFADRARSIEEGS